MKPASALWRLVLCGIASAALLTLVVNAVAQPVDSTLRTYVAEFTDVSGLHPGADVRVRGVRVGKVESVSLERQDVESIGAVSFTMDTKYGVVPRTRLAVKYQALTGLRYVDVVDSAQGYSPKGLVLRIPTNMTQPSFDITSLFNGLQPVIATLDPDQLNLFTANAASFLSGDGTGLGPVLESMQKLTELLTNRQHVIAALMQNLAGLAETVRGESLDFLAVIDGVDRSVDEVLKVLDELRKSQVFGPAFATPLARLMKNMGLVEDADIDRGLDNALTNVDNAMDALKLIPVMWGDIDVPDGEPVPCAHGRAQLPETVDILLNGQRVVLCNR
ncbi:MCE family protein [Mycolicibacterium neoaurum]|uniref:MlaD family protein n=1 Tax=Mycolicibacterium neoaurum TaxID=1795 RepID=UPI001BCE556E|nr:MlaD family protein [Mycolicibacterium neoaurum]QVI27221.1 MCE family protein [Mycolicibacterium neoaurum]